MHRPTSVEEARQIGSQHGHQAAMCTAAGAYEHWPLKEYARRNAVANILGGDRELEAYSQGFQQSYRKMLGGTHD